MATSVWRGYIAFGLVSIPVKLYRAARPERVKLREVYRIPAAEEIAEAPRPGPVLARRAAPVAQDAEEDQFPVAPVRRAVVDNAGGEIPRSAVSKGYEVAQGQFVTLAPEELSALAPKTSATIELVEFVNLSSVDPVYFETSYYVQPDPVAEKPYALLYQSLKQTGLVGVAQVAMHRREHIILIRSGKSGLIAHTMYFSSEVRAEQEHKTDPALVNPKELELASTLVNALKADFAPEKFRDTYRERLEELIASKSVAHPQPAASPAAPVRPAVDIMEALRKSLAGIKKPPAGAPSAPMKQRKKG